MNNRPIGIFDSGVGGLTVVKEVMKRLPCEDVVYFGDTARVPYGSKSVETVTRFSRQIMCFLLSRGVKAVIIACNTVCSNSYQTLVEEFDIPILEMIGCGARAGIAATKNNRIGVIGTQATIRSGAYEKTFAAQAPEIQVFSKACPLFVPLAEEGWTDNGIARDTAKTYISGLIEKQIDTLVLGCTHYPLLMPCIESTVGESVRVVNPAVLAAEQAELFLREKNLLKSGKTASAEFFISDRTDSFQKISGLLLGEEKAAELVDIESY